MFSIAYPINSHSFDRLLPTPVRSILVLFSISCSCKQGLVEMKWLFLGYREDLFEVL